MRTRATTLGRELQLRGSCDRLSGTPGGSDSPVHARNDGNANTGNDPWDANCNCVGQLIDCQGTPGGSALPGTACNDGNANTGNDQWDANCNCVGQLIDCQDYQKVSPYRVLRATTAMRTRATTSGTPTATAWVS
ncbi:MAG: hypothetical protein H6596_05530 [Flavobacteriales bacterium]|nr:hypothetical protein [Flavobacteriales bacterium]